MLSFAALTFQKTSKALDSRAILAHCALFADLPATALDRLAGLCTPRSLRGGEVLFRTGDAADHLHIVASGRIRIRGNDGSLFADVARYEPIGEISLLSGDHRNGDAYALRDSLLLDIEGAALMAFVLTYPTALLAMTRIIVQRMRRDRRQTLLEAARREHSIAVVSLLPDVDVEAIADQICAALRGCCATPCERISAASVDAAFGKGIAQTPLGETTAHHQLMAWLDARERCDQHLVYSAGPADDAWTERCLRQCDRVLVVVPAQSVPSDTALLETLRQLELRVPVDLVLLRPERAAAGDVAGWRLKVGAGTHYFVRPDVADDYAKLARQLSGHGIGLVLGGGGARGFAHIGLLRALEELHIPIDLTGGTSMGAFFAALRAWGLDSREAQRVARASFVDHNYLNDYVLPRVSLLRGRKFLQHLRVLFGDTRIEELRTPFFAVSTNLTRASTMVHDSGPLATWVGTSMAVPGVVPPVAWHGDLLVDGAVTNSLPTDVMHAMGRGPIIASDVSTEGSLQAPGIEGPDPEALLDQRGRPGNVTLIDILFGGMSLTSESGVRMRAERADLYLRMPVADFRLFDWKRIDAAVERGYAYAMEQLQKDGQEFLRRR
ncbi:MAG: cyclic nucleotide-binding protein [Nevskia sp.]|nr:cyclic nucleotide-binding protein [Nevskia sp.]